MRTPRLRLLSAILAVALFFTLLPVSALAEVGGSNANTGLTIGITGSTESLNYWDVSNSISMKEVSPAVYEVTFENKSYEDIFGIGCTGGHHRSVAVAHALSEYIQSIGYPVTEIHRDITR